MCNTSSASLPRHLLPLEKAYGLYASLWYVRETKRLPYGVVVAVSQRVNVIWTVEDAGPYRLSIWVTSRYMRTTDIVPTVCGDGTTTDKRI